MNNPDISASSIKFDQYYLRGYLELLRMNNRSAEVVTPLVTAALLCASVPNEGGKLIKDLVSNSHSQLVQDIVCVLVSEQKREGYFVEVGVGDGETLSNTLLLERDFGWRGILAEPANRFEAAIRGKRKATLDTRAVAARSGDTLVFEEDVHLGELSGLAGVREARGNQTLRKYQVKTITLDDLLDQHDAPDYIDYLSIDTEGSELQVLEGLSLNRRRVGLFTIEHNLNLEKIAALRQRLIPLGYRQIFANVSNFDIWFVHNDVSSRYL
ncbi:methyltransferase [Mesorhizobium sp. LSHC420B00]|uniref:FkbM family methyltransferase n=1 Tax=unclassified Mesorhizobium TaxID=325217 RepID=UPI0003CF55B4|nr:FkbM family methyltransferase [Mesorhizobium sp. LSHC420B00]ESX65407.1 methyltransferase [Mesorhizobium sp. LSHC420B00]